MSPTPAPIVFSLAAALSLLAIGCGPSSSDMSGSWSGTMDTLASGEVEVRNTDDPLWSQKLLAIGCGPSSSDMSGSWSGTMDTLASGEVEVRNTGDPLWCQKWQVEEEWRIGSDTSGGPELFGNIGSFDVDAKGRVYILDDQAQEIRIFDSEGAFVRTVGSKGEGPGEFVQATSVDVSSNGEIWVTEMQQGQLNIFDSTGSLLKVERSNSPGSIILPYPGGFDRVGRFNVVIYYRLQEAYTWAMARFDQSFSPIDTILTPKSPVEPKYFEILGDDGSSRISMGVPFQGSFQWRFAPKGNFWTLLADRYELVEITTSGEVLRKVTKEHESLPVTAADRREFEESAKWFTRQGGKIDWSKVPETKPAVVSFFCDDEGNLWVEQRAENSEDEGYLFDIFDPEGRYLGTLRLPFSLQGSRATIVRNGILYGKTTDELGAPVLVRARVVKS